MQKKYNGVARCFDIPPPHQHIYTYACIQQTLYEVVIIMPLTGGRQGRFSKAAKDTPFSCKFLKKKKSPTTLRFVFITVLNATAADGIGNQLILVLRCGMCVRTLCPYPCSSYLFIHFFLSPLLFISNLKAHPNPLTLFFINSLFFIGNVVIFRGVMWHLQYLSLIGQEKNSHSTRLIPLKHFY